MNATLTAVGLTGALILAATGDPTFSDLKSLGVIALALIVGAAGVYRWGMLPERKRTEQERTDKLAAEARERALRDAYEARIIPMQDGIRVLGELATVMKQRPRG